MSPRWAPPALLLVVAFGLVACDTGDGRTLEDPPPGATAPPQPADTTATSGAALVNPPVGSGEITAMSLGSPVFAAGEPIPVRHSCEAENLSPPLTWSGVPAEAVELALTVVDTDVESGQFVHWVVAGLDPSITGLDEGIDVVVQGAVEARNDATEFGWYGPCPPPGETHRYVFTLYAPSAPAAVQPGATGADVLAQLAASGATTSTLTGTFTSS